MLYQWHDTGWNAECQAGARAAIRGRGMLCRKADGGGESDDEDRTRALRRAVGASGGASAEG